MVVMKNDYAEIPIANRPGEYFKVDVEYEKEFRKYKWTAYKKDYKGKSFRIQTRHEGVTFTWQKIMSLHRKVITFKNGDKLDMRSSNLIVPENPTKFHGVHKTPSGNYKAQVSKDRKNFYGSARTTAYESAEEADRLRIKHGGDLTKLNFPESLEKYKAYIETEKDFIEEVKQQKPLDSPVVYVWALNQPYDLGRFSTVEEAKRVKAAMEKAIEDIETSYIGARRPVQTVEVEKIVEVEVVKEVVKYVEVVKPSLLKRWFGITTEIDE